MRLRLLAVSALLITILAGCTEPCPGGVTATLQASGDILVKWDAVDGAAGYFIMRGVDGGPGQLYDTAEATANPSYTDVNVTVGHTYSYSVFKVGEGTPVDACPPVDVKVPDAQVPFFGVNGAALGLAGALMGALMVLLRRR